MKKGKKLICGFLAVTLVTGLWFNNVSSMSVKGVSADQRPTKEIVKDVYVYTDEYIPLLDTEDNEIAGYYKTTNGGYAIIENGGDVIEFDDDTAIDSVKENKDLYYMGVTQIFERKKDKLVSVMDTTYEIAFNNVQEEYVNFIAEAQKNNDVMMASNNEDESVVNEVETATTQTIGSEYEETGGPQRTVAPSVWIDLKDGYGNTLVKNTYCLNTNSGTNCSATAAAIMLLYYDKYVDTKYVNNSYRKKSKWQDFTDLMIDYIKPDENGANAIDMKRGINKYLKSKGIGQVCKFVIKDGLFGDTKDVLIRKIDANRPVILSAIGHPYYNNHAVVAEGYFIQNSGKKYTFACINDGWGNNRTKGGKRLYINMTYVANLIYLD